MNDQGDALTSRNHRSWWRTPAGLMFLALLVAAMAFWATGHRAHIMVVVPYLVLMACPLMHLFHHRKHQGRYGHDAGDERHESARNL
jgi:hypothetical protein